MTRAQWELTQDRFLSEQEVEAVLQQHLQSASDGEQSSAAADQLIVHGFVYSGLRNSEFRRLRVADTIVGIGRSVFQVHGTPRQDRIVYVPDAMSSLVTRYVSEIRPGTIPVAMDPEDRSLSLISQ